MTYPIAEIFHSVQGEGFWTGTPMMFVRLAGCNVGKYEPKAEKTLVNKLCSMGVSDDKLLVLEAKHSICTTFDGQKFVCDTNYHATEKLTPAEIADRLAGEEHVCITGGEPLMYDLSYLVGYFKPNIMLHFETSGTKPWRELLANEYLLWVTLCPKEGFIEDTLDYADEIKLLVGPNFDEERMKGFEYFSKHLYLQPINGVHEVWKENLAHCLDLLKRHPQWKLSAQLHKYLEVR